MTIAEMEPGPEMDALVAKAIGCVGVTTPAGTWWYLDGNPIHSMPRFSTDVAAAWLVVEKMRESGYLVRIQEHPDGFPFYLDADDSRSAIHKRVLCLVERVGLGLYNVDGRAYADTAPLAICRAALMALEA